MSYFFNSIKYLENRKTRSVQLSMNKQTFEIERAIPK